MVLVLCPSVLVFALALNLVVLLTSLQDANLDRRRGELTRSAHPDAPFLARRGEPTPNTLSVEEFLSRLRSQTFLLETRVLAASPWGAMGKTVFWP